MKVDIEPKAQIQTDDALLDYARRNGGTCYHASCTCLMGTHPMSVVDNELRVRGLDGLRIIDVLGDACGHLDQYQRPDDHDRREGAAMIKGIARQRLAA